MRDRSYSTLLLFLALLSFGSACAVRRETGPGRPIGTYDYAVLSQETAHRYYSTAESMLGQSFVVIDENDARLQLPQVRQKACTVAIDWAPGFWSTSGWVELKDYAHGAHVHTSQMRRGMFWAGAHADVVEAIHDVAAARAAGPPLPPGARDPLPVVAENDATAATTLGRSTAQRLEDLNNLRARGLISEAEYSAQRKKIIAEH
jgi:hypothetical protein